MFLSAVRTRCTMVRNTSSAPMAAREVGHGSQVTIATIPYIQLDIQRNRLANKLEYGLHLEMQARNDP